MARKRGDAPKKGRRPQKGETPKKKKRMCPISFHGDDEEEERKMKGTYAIIMEKGGERGKKGGILSERILGVSDPSHTAVSAGKRLTKSLTLLEERIHDGLYGPF